MYEHVAKFVWQIEKLKNNAHCCPTNENDESFQKISNMFRVCTRQMIKGFLRIGTYVLMS
jgi:hypothetical protein